ncbi:hypothetical protein [Craterilacuibacter sp.]|uniref:hypothetical protein n=1 Tax=Craterilacuibacter sp. TaxID=2870909 RepID=UPI003F665688
MKLVGAPPGDACHTVFSVKVNMRIAKLQKVKRRYLPQTAATSAAKMQQKGGTKQKAHLKGGLNA